MAPAKRAPAATRRGPLRRRRPLPALLLLGVFAAGPALAGSAERGKQIFAMAAGCGCHTTGAGPVGAGGDAIKTPFGTFYASNITPDPETGIGKWTDDEIDAAIRKGRLPDGDAETPAMPYYLYAGMSDADVADLIDYLRNLPAAKRENRPHEGELPLARWAYWAWSLLFFRPEAAPAVAPAAGVERGRYLADHVALCADCHTPRTKLGAVDTVMYMAGTTEGAGGHPVPNITPHQTGIADWDAADVVNLVRKGRMPDFDSVDGAMKDVVDGVGGGPGYKDAPESDVRAIADYLRTVAPIDNKVDDD